MTLPTVPLEDWYETAAMDHGVTLIHEPHIYPFFRCNMWHVRGRDRDMLVDTGLGWFSLSAAEPWLHDRPLVCISSHTHFDHIGSTHEFTERLVHPLEADIQADPQPALTLADPYLVKTPPSDIFTALPEGWDPAAYVVEPAPATGFADDGDVVDLGDRRFRVIHTPGHSPGGIALFEEHTGILISGDIVYDEALVTDCYHSDMDDYRATMRYLRDLEPAIVHGGHGPSFGLGRYREIIDTFLAEHA